MKIIVGLMIGIITIGGVLFFTPKQDVSQILTDEIIIKIQNLEYKDTTFKKKTLDNGYIVYKNGLIQKYDNIQNKQEKTKQLSSKETNEIQNLIENIDETKVNTIMTSEAVTSGREIIAYNSQNKEIIIKDFYRTNYSDSAEKIMDKLKKENLLGRVFNFGKNSEEIPNKPINLTFTGGLSEPQDGIKWSYEIDMNKKESTKYCSSTGLLRDEKLIEEYGYNKRKTRKLSETEYSILINIMNENDKYLDDGKFHSDGGYKMYNDDISMFIPVSDVNANILKNITEGY